MHAVRCTSMAASPRHGAAVRTGRHDATSRQTARPGNFCALHWRHWSMAWQRSLLPPAGRASRRWANLYSAFFSRADLSYADLSHAGLNSANLNHANFDHAVLHNADLTGAKLGGTRLKSADLTGAKFDPGANK